MRWYNAADNAKVASADVGSYEVIPYGTDKAGMKHATDRPPHPEHGQWQVGIACSRTSRTIVIDIDEPDRWIEGSTYVELGDWVSLATSYRDDGLKAHIAVAVPENLLHLWPTQGPTVWGDVKSNGFSYIEGQHYSGKRYVSTQHPWVEATAELLTALTADRIFPQGKSGLMGTMAGPWQDDNYRIESHDECVATVYAMAQEGLDDDHIRERLELIMPNREGAWPGRDAYIEEKIRSATRKIAYREKKEQDSFGGLIDGGYAAWAGELESRRQAAERELQERAAARQIIYETPEAERPPLTLAYGNDQSIARQILGYSALMGYAYAADTGAYFMRSGDHWERCPEDPCLSIIARVADLVPKPKDTNFDPNDKLKADDPEYWDKKLYTTLHMSATSNRIAAKMRAVWPTVEPRLREMDMDSDGRVFWAGGVPYDLRTLEIANVDPTMPHLLTANYVPRAGETPLWDELNKAQFPDDELREYALNVLASVMRGGNKLLPNFKSDGNMGKTTRLMTLVDILGTYAEQLPVQLLTGRTGHDESFLRLKGKRLVWMDETPPASKVATEKLKNLSGGGQLTGRAMFGRQSVTFSMQHTLLLAGNEDLPLTDENVYGIRVRYLPITGDRSQIGAVSRKIWDGHGGLSDEWKKEAPAVLHEMMQRASRVMARPSLTDMHELALAPFADAIIEQDHIARFVQECCESKGQTGGGLLYEAFVAWGLRNNLSHADIPSNTKFGIRLNKMGYPANKSSAIRERGLTLRAGMFAY
jgi:phage/plasmid-associated DNA primase